MRAKLLLAASVLLLAPVPAFAYIDPGTGSYLVQLLIGGVLASGFIIKTQWKRLTAWFKGRGKHEGAVKDDAKG